MSQPSFTAPGQPGMACFRHPQRVTYTRCQRCGRPICPECMTRLDGQTLCPDDAARAMPQDRRYGFARRRRALRLGHLDAAYTTTALLIAANVAVWLAILATGSGASPVLRAFQLSPLGTCLLGSDPSRYLPGVGAAQCQAITGMVWSPGVASGAFWQVLTSAFTHVQIWHIGFNMLALFFLGPSLERAVGRPLFLGLHLTSALTASAAVMWFSGVGSGTVGASGAIFGLMGALLMLAWRRHGDVRGVLTWLGLNVAFTFLNGGVSWQGHLGGLVGGALVGLIIASAPRTLGRVSLPRRAHAQWAGTAAVALVAAGLIALRALRLAGALG